MQIQRRDAANNNIHGGMGMTNQLNSSSGGNDGITASDSNFEQMKNYGDLSAR